MEQYKSHKIVEAGQIVEVDVGRIVLVSGEAVRPKLEYFSKHQPEVGGYYVRYSDGYESYSPAQAFEAGYTRIADMEARLIDAVAAEPIMRYFTYKHLPVGLQVISRKWCELALETLDHPRGPERSVALRKLLEGKDAAVRAALP